MAGLCSRRRFLAGGAAAAISGMIAARAVSGNEAQKDENTLDIHLHLFGTGDGGSGCRLAEAITKGPLFQLLAARLRIEQRGTTMDEGYVLALAEHLEDSAIAKGVVLAQDAVYDRHGKPDWEKTSFYVPNDYVLHVASRFSQTMIPCVSINPQRADAIEELDRCAEKGAKVLKIHPPTQGVDLLEKKHVPFFRRCVELKVVVMVHTGHEHSAPIVSADLANPRRLRWALEEGCTVVACHSGTGWPTDAVDMLPEFLAMVRRHKNLWGDTSVLGSAGRVRDMSRLLADDEAKSRLLHGSDFPFPSAPLAFAGTLGVREAARVQSIQNAISQDFALKEALGIGRASAERAYRLICGDES